VKFVGRLVGSGVHRPDPQRLQGLAKMEPPRTKKELRKLLGACGYSREYIQNYSDIAKPLTDLTHNNVPSVIVSRWSIDCQQSFERLRAELVNSHAHTRLASGKLGVNGFVLTICYPPIR